MKNLYFLFLMLISNNFLFSMEIERKNTLTRYSDSKNQSWYVDKEILFEDKNTISPAWFNKSGTKIKALSIYDDHVYIWNRADGKLLERVRGDHYYVLRERSDESSEEDSFEPGFTREKGGIIFHSTSGVRELVWLNKLY